jgi:Flp pilus assembly protein TadD
MTDTTDTPFPGPRPFSLNETECFFGRAKETRDLADLILAYPLVVLSAQSGAGKTSLINAGLARHTSGEDVSILLTRVSGRIPADRIAAIENVFVYNCLCGLGTLDGKSARKSPQNLEQVSLIDGVLGVLRGLDLVVPPASDATPQVDPASGSKRVPRFALVHPTIMVIDQFEEIFSSHQERWKDRRPFFEQLALLLTALPDLHVLLAIRDDYVSGMDPFAPLLPGSLRIRYRLERLRREQAIEAIEKPMGIQRYECVLRSGIARAVVRNLLKTNVVRTPGVPDTGPIEGEYVEPVHLQVVCGNLWEAMRAAQPLAPEVAAKLTADETLAQNEEALIFTRGEKWFHGESAKVSDVDGILRAMYDRAVLRGARYVKGREKYLRRFIDEELITVGRTRGLIDVATAESRGVPVSGLKSLEDDRILRRETRAGAEWYELTHDRFIRPVRESNQAWRERTVVPRWLWLPLVCLLLVVALLLGGLVRHQRNKTEEAKKEAQSQKTDLDKKVQDAETKAKKAEELRVLRAKEFSKDLAEEHRDEFQLKQAILNARSVEELKNLKTAVTKDVDEASPPSGGDSEARNKARRFWNQGYERSLAGKTQLATRWYRQAIDADPRYAPAYNSLGIVEHNNGQLDLAAQFFGQAISCDPKYVPAYVNLAGLELMRNNPARARELAEKVLGIRPNYGPAKRILKSVAALTAPTE